MALREREQAIECFVTHAAFGRIEALPNELLEESQRDQPDLHRFRAPVEGLILVIEEPAHHVALAARVDVRDVLLLLKDRPHQCREARVNFCDLLELVEVDDDVLAFVSSDNRRKLEQTFERVVDLFRRTRGGEAEAERSIWIHGHDRCDA